MVLEELVSEVHRDLSDTLTQAIAHKENPTIIRILKNLVKLTTFPGMEEFQKKENQDDFEKEKEVATKPLAMMPTPLPVALRPLNFSQAMEQEQAAGKSVEEVTKSDSTAAEPPRISAQNFSQRVWDEQHPKL